MFLAMWCSVVWCGAVKQHVAYPHTLQYIYNTSTIHLPYIYHTSTIHLPYIYNTSPYTPRPQTCKLSSDKMFQRSFTVMQGCCRMISFSVHMASSSVMMASGSLGFDWFVEVVVMVLVKYCLVPCMVMMVTRVARLRLGCRGGVHSGWWW